MAGDAVKTSGLTELTVPPSGEDLFAVVDVSDPTQAPTGTTKNIKQSTLMQAVTGPRGFMINGKLAVTVASNNLTVAIKTLADADPSATDPVYVRIGDTVRVITAALSVTVNAGTNWCNAGSAELATKEIDYFPYLVWNTSLATPAVDILCSRIPYANLFSEFSATSTNEKYAMQNATAPAATDVCENIGRFAATLSAGAGYTWTVPTYTADNLINRPIYETRWLTWVPVYSGYSSDPTVSSARYKLDSDMVNITYILGTNGTSNATTATISVPFTVAVSTPLMIWTAVTDNGSLQTAQGHAQSTAGSNSLSMWKTFYQGAWTNSGAKGQNLPQFSYRIR